MSGEPEVLFERRGPVGLITLNRPKALNALNMSMAQAINLQMKKWAHDASVQVVVIIGAGERAFCAGGDIRATVDAAKRNDPYAHDFFHHEYILNTAIKEYKKPYIALIHGICMGGGVGLSVHGRIRVVCETTLFAMPETGIGFYPDVGGSYFLPRLPGQIGTYLALTGNRLKSPDLIYAGIATHHAPYARFPAILDALTGGGAPDETLSRFVTDAGEPTLPAIRERIDRAFAHHTVEAIIDALKNEGEWGEQTASLLLTKSPTSMKITLRQMHEGAKLSFEECMRMELRLSTRFAHLPDFHEGVRAAIVDKDQKPKWNPATLAEISDADVARFFAP